MIFIKNQQKTFYEHLNDLRKLLIFLLLAYIPFFIICFIFIEDVFKFVTRPFIKVLTKHNLSNQLVVTNVTEIFGSYLKLSFFSSLFIYMPLFFITILLFIIPIFEKKDRKTVIILAVFSPCLFFLGASFSYFLFLHMVWEFFINYYIINSGVLLLPKVSEYINFVLSVILIFGAIFQLPIVIIIMVIANVITPKDILKYSKHFIVGSFIIGAIVTPADPFSQIIVASILMTLYYLSYFITVQLYKN